MRNKVYYKNVKTTRMTKNTGSMDSEEKLVFEKGRKLRVARNLEDVARILYEFYGFDYQIIKTESEHRDSVTI